MKIMFDEFDKKRKNNNEYLEKIEARASKYRLLRSWARDIDIQKKQIDKTKKHTGAVSIRLEYGDIPYEVTGSYADAILSMRLEIETQKLKSMIKEYLDFSAELEEER